MPEYIEREVVLKLLNRNIITKHITFADDVSIYDTIKNIPAADVVEVKHGEWLPVFHNDKFKGGKCSECGKYKKSHNITFLIKNYKFCHSCGAKMDK